MLKKRFEGEPKLSDFELEEQELRDITDGGKNECAAFDFTTSHTDVVF